MALKTIRDIEEFNEGRIPHLLKLKYKGMRGDLFAFFRGTAHLFYQHLRKNDIIHNSPKVWICGDLHFENFGSFKGENGLVYFDINDFDEATLGPCLYDISRFLVSLRLITELSEMRPYDTDKLCNLFIKVYCQTLLTGNSRWVEKETAKGIVKELLEKVADRKPKADMYSHKKGNSRELDFKNKKLIKPTNEEKSVIRHLIAAWNKEHKARAIFDIIDIGYHLKGTGSLGIGRYILLVQKKSNKKHKLIDLKMATPSCVTALTDTVQPFWKSEAERTIEIQKRVQGTFQALLHHIEFDEKSYVLREYQSSEDKINYKALNGDVKKFKTVVTTMAQITAWGQLQSSGRQGSACADELIEFAQNQKKWHEKLIEFTKESTSRVKEDYKIFCDSYKQITKPDPEVEVEV